MAQKVAILLGCLALAKAGVVGTDYSPAEFVSYSSISSSPIVTKTITGPNVKTIITPTTYTKATPAHYETVISTEESKYKTPDGAEHSAFSKSFDTEYSYNNFDSHKSNGDLLTHSIPTPVEYTGIHANPVYGNHGYNLANPVYHVVSTPSKSVSVPITYSSPITKTIITPSESYGSYTSIDKTKVFNPISYSTPITKTTVSYATPKLDKSAYFSHTPVLVSQPIKSINYDSYATSVDKSKVLTPTYYSYPITNAIAPSITYGGTPVVEKSSEHVSHVPVVVSKSAITYSEAPVVSHLSFSGLGTSYAW